MPAASVTPTEQYLAHDSSIARVTAAGSSNALVELVLDVDPDEVVRRLVHLVAVTRTS